MYEKGNNSCSTGKKGTYYAPLDIFVKAYTRQKSENAYYLNNDFDVPGAVRYLTCTKYDPYYGMDDDVDEDNRRFLYEDEMVPKLSRRRLNGDDDGAGAGDDAYAGDDAAAANDDAAGEEAAGDDAYVGDDAYAGDDAASDDDKYANVPDLYLQMSCHPTTGKAFVMHAYKDSSCTKRIKDDSTLNSIESELAVSYLTVKFGACTDCVIWPENTDDDGSKHSNDFTGDDDQFWSIHGYDSPMCKTAWQNRKQCGAKCRLMMSGRSSNTSGDFSKIGKFFLFVFTLSLFGLTFLVNKERKNVSTEKDPLRKVGVEPKHFYIAAPILLIVLFIAMLAEMRKLTWTFVLIPNALLLAYWVVLGFLCVSCLCCLVACTLDSRDCRLPRL